MLKPWDGSGTDGRGATGLKKSLVPRTYLHSHTFRHDTRRHLEVDGLAIRGHGGLLHRLTQRRVRVASTRDVLR